MTTVEGDVAMFSTHTNAERAGEENPLGAAYGFEIVSWETAA